jgi:hypothetical protein
MIGHPDADHLGHAAKALTVWVAAADGNGFLDWADLALKSLVVIALVTGVHQLLEARRKRNVDTYWELLNRYVSSEGRASRDVLREVEDAIDLPTHALIDVSTDEIRRTANAEGWAETYNRRFHDTQDEARQHVHPAVLYRLRYLNQAAVLLKKNLVDRDLLLGLIADGVKIDRPLLIVALTAIRQREGFRVYPRVDDLFEDVRRYIEKT